MLLPQCLIVLMMMMMMPVLVIPLASGRNDPPSEFLFPPDIAIEDSIPDDNYFFPLVDFDEVDIDNISVANVTKIPKLRFWGMSWTAPVQTPWLMHWCCLWKTFQSIRHIVQYNLKSSRTWKYSHRFSRLKGST